MNKIKLLKCPRLLDTFRNNVTEFECICKEFLFHKEKQFSLPFSQDLPKKFKEIMIHGVYPKTKNFTEFLFNKQHYLYGKTNLESLVFDSVRKIELKELKQNIKDSVFINGKKYYSNFIKIINKDNVILQFGKNVKIKLIGNKLEMSIDFKGCLSDRLNDSNFVLDFYKYGSISSNKSKIIILKHEIKEEDIELIFKYNNFLINTMAFLKIFNISANEIDLDSMSATDSDNLNGLINTFVLNKEFPNQKINQGLIKIKISNITLLLAAIQKNQKIIVQDINDFKTGDVYFKPNNNNKCDLPKTPISIYILLKADDLITSTNVRLKNIISDIIKIDHSEIFDTEVNLLVLEMIKAYDKTNENSYLTSAKRILKWLEQGFIDAEILTINMLQIAKRRRKLKIQEIRSLKNMVISSKEHFELLACIGILLDDENMFKQNYEMLSVEQKANFNEYPIYSLLR